MSMRLFVGVALDDTVRTELSRRVQLEPACVPQGLRWLPPHNWHLTLQFLGRVGEARVEPLHEACARAAAACAPFALEFSGSGAFPSARRARVVWIGVSRGQEQLADLFETLLTHTEPLGFAREQRAFRAHLTVGRLAAPVGVEPLIAALEVPALEMPVRELTLFRSHLSSRGADYEALARWPLRG